ncbi:MAG: type II toxin-antitoxin system RelE/ParE family toxin [Patescibacteria group bacterium]
MDKIAKALRRFSSQERTAAAAVIAKLAARDFTGLDIQKLKGWQNIYRVRVGDIRIIYQLDRAGCVVILAVQHRSSTTYSRW